MLFKGIIGRLSILFGVLIGYVAAILQHEVDFSRVAEASWIGLPEFSTPAFDPSTLGLFVPVVFVLIAENVGHVKSVSAMTCRLFRLGELFGGHRNDVRDHEERSNDQYCHDGCHDGTCQILLTLSGIKEALTCCSTPRLLRVHVTNLAEIHCECDLAMHGR